MPSFIVIGNPKQVVNQTTMTHEGVQKLSHDWQGLLTNIICLIYQKIVRYFQNGNHKNVKIMNNTRYSLIIVYN